MYDFQHFQISIISPILGENFKILQNIYYNTDQIITFKTSDLLHNRSCYTFLNNIIYNTRIMYIS